MLLSVLLDVAVRWALLAFVAWMAYELWWWLTLDRELLRFPGPKLVLPVFGTLLSMPWQMIDRTTHEYYFSKLYKKWGKNGSFRMYIGKLQILTTINPEVIKEVIGSGQHPRKPAIYGLVFSRVFGNGLVTSHGDIWKQHRHAITPTFHAEILRNYAIVMNKQGNILAERLAKWPTGEPGDMHNPVNMCAFDTILETAMGVEIHAQTSGERHWITDSFQHGAQQLTDRLHKIWLHNDCFFYNFTLVGRRMASMIERVTAFSQNVIDKRREEVKENPQAATKSKRKAFLDLLLTSPKPDGSFFNDQELIDQVNTFIGAGHDTTGSSTVWCLQLLGRPENKEILKKLQEEIDQVIGDCTDVTLEHLAEMKYLDLVVKEGLRIYPGVPIFARELEQDIIVEDHKIPKGTIVLIDVLSMHRSKEIWGENAHVFDPERFQLDRENGRHPYSFIPFSAGARNCIGQKFALQEEKILLIKILQHFDIEAVKERVPSMYQIVLNPIGGVPMKLFPRTKQT